jgi:hypothetical protein
MNRLPFCRTSRIAIGVVERISNQQYVVKNVHEQSLTSQGKLSALWEALSKSEHAHKH